MSRDIIFEDCQTKKLLQRQADVAIVYFGYCNVRPLGALQSDVALCQRIAMLEAWSNVNEPFNFNFKYV
jgi:hypothetical protein